MNPAGTQLGTRVAFSFETLAHDARSRQRYAAARVKSTCEEGIDGTPDNFFAKTTNAKDRRENARR